MTAFCLRRLYFFACVYIQLGLWISMSFSMVHALSIFIKKRDCMLFAYTSRHKNSLARRGCRFSSFLVDCSRVYIARLAVCNETREKSTIWQNPKLLDQWRRQGITRIRSNFRIWATSDILETKFHQLEITNGHEKLRA